MEKATRMNRWRLAASASALVLVLNATGCARLGGLVPGNSSDTSSSADDSATAARPALAPAGTTSGAGTNPTGSPTPAAARPGQNPPVAARIGSVAHTLAIVG